jgi:hypothetical protein
MNPSMYLYAGGREDASIGGAIITAIVKIIVVILGGGK